MHITSGDLNDVYRFDVAAATWTALSPSGPIPVIRYYMGFTSTPDGMLYVFGGYVQFASYGGDPLLLLLSLVCLLGVCAYVGVDELQLDS